MTAAEAIRVAVEAVPDPELPVLTIAELGILRAVMVRDGRAVVTVTPTYSGCPATEAIAADVVAAAKSAGASEVEVRTVLAPAWTSDWISADGRRKLAAAGIAPPPENRPSGAVTVALSVRCPQCGSPDTRQQSRFSSTACKSLWVCANCRETFEHFKAH